MAPAARTTARSPSAQDADPVGASRLVALFHHRWSVPVVAEVARSKGCKFVTLVKRLGVSRDSLRRTLDELRRLDLVVRNPGYGHPMRPEYVLGPAGVRIAAPVRSLWRALRSADHVRIGLQKWSCPTLAAVGRGACRFSELRAVLPQISPRALALALKELEACGWLRRIVESGYPPSTRYRATPTGRRLQRHLTALAAALP